MAIPLLKTCCICCSLRTGTICIAVFRMISLLVNIIQTISWYHQTPDINVKKMLLISFAMLTFFFVLQIPLLWGAIKESPSCLKTWLIANSGIEGMGYITLIVMACLHLLPMMLLVFAIFNILLSLYFIWVTYSFYVFLHEPTSPIIIEMTEKKQPTSPRKDEL